MIDVEKCKITHYPSSVLGKPAEPVEKIDETIYRLVDKMTDIMIENKGMGLAAPQAGVGLRLFIISMDGSREQVRAYVNPTVTTAGDLEETGRRLPFRARDLPEDPAFQEGQSYRDRS